MHRVWVLAAALCAGCFSKPGFSGGSAGDGGTDGATDGTGDGASDSSIDAPPCTAAWPNPTNVTDLNNDVTGEPTATGDLEEVYWAYQNGSSWEIHWASVTTPGTLSYTNRGRAVFHTIDDGFDQDPSITDDGLVLVYRTGANEAAARVKVVTRPDRMSAWSSPVDLQGLTAVAPSTLDLSGDGLTIYYNVGQTLRYATRSIRTAAFVEQPTSLGNNFPFPAISGDQLTMYYSSTSNGVFKATRTSLTNAFTAAGTVFAASTMLLDPDVTQDGTTMVMGTRNGYTLAISKRTCP